jgi:Tfp pilus assembly protein PilZ
MQEYDNRRRFPRLDVPLFHRSAGLLGPRQRARNVSRGGIRVETDDALRVGDRLEIELFLPGEDSFSIDVRVAWVSELSGQEARFEAGLEFLEMDALRRTQLERCLAEHERD